MESRHLFRIFAALIICVFTHSEAWAQVEEQRLVELTDKDYEAAMQGMGDEFLSRFENMPRIRFVLKQDRRFYNSQGQLHALAFYTRDESRKPVIYVNPSYTNRASYKQMVNTVFHELIHAWVDWKGLGDNIAQGHGEAFIRKALEIGVNIDSTLAAYPEARRIYERLLADANSGRTRGRTTGSDSSDSRRRSNPIEDNDYGQDVYDFKFVTSASDPEKIKLLSSYTLKVRSKPTIGARYRWREQSWRVYLVKGSTVWLTEANRDQDVYDFKFVTSASDPGNIELLATVRMKMSSKPTIGARYRWRNRSWRIYSIKGSIVWLTEAKK